MDKYIFDEGNGLWYELIGDYYFPCLTVPTEEEQPVGIWGQRHKRYIKEYHPALYNALLLNGRLNSYLADIDQQAQERLDTIIEQMARSQGITEALKAADQMTWVGKMNNIQASAMEIVNSELIYTLYSLIARERLSRISSTSSVVRYAPCKLTLAWLVQHCAQTCPLSISIRNSWPSTDV